MTNTPYLIDLLAQPQSLRDTLAALKEPPSLADFPARVRSGAFRQIVLTGMGSSYHVFIPFQIAMAEQGSAPLLVETSELIYTFQNVLNGGALVIAASQSGRSAEIVELVERRSSFEFALLGLTNTPDSTLAQSADAAVITRAGYEATVSCKTYLASLMALFWLGRAINAAPLEWDELNSVPDRVEAYLERWQEHTARLSEQLKGARDIFLVGRGASLASALYGGLIIKEAAHVHSEGMSSAAFRHGPFEMVSKESFLVVFEGVGQEAGLNRRLYQDITGSGGRGALVSVSGDGPFRLADSAPALLQILEALPAQMMTLALAELNGREAGRFEHSGKVTTVL